MKKLLILLLCVLLCGCSASQAEREKKSTEKYQKKLAEVMEFKSDVELYVQKLKELKEEFPTQYETYVQLAIQASETSSIDEAEKIIYSYYQVENKMNSFGNSNEESYTYDRTVKAIEALHAYYASVNNVTGLATCEYILPKVQEGNYLYQPKPTWIVENTLEFDNVDVVSRFNNETKIVFFGLGGLAIHDPKYFEESYWGDFYTLDDPSTPVPTNYEGYYDDDLVEVKRNKKYSIYNYEGEKLTPFSTHNFYYCHYDVYITTPINQTGYWQYLGWTSKSKESFKYFGTDFQTNKTYSAESGIGGYDLEYSVLVYSNDKVMLNTYTYDDNGKSSLTKSVEQKDLLSNNNVLVLSNSSTRGKGSDYLVHADGKAYKIDGNVVNYYLVNGYVLAKKDNKYALFTDKAENVTGYKYDYAYYFMDGYAAVKKDGKWGYINEKGEEVTPFLFEAARPTYKGMSWVKVNGKWGVLDLKTSLDNKADFNKMTF